MIKSQEVSGAIKAAKIPSRGMNEVHTDRYTVDAETSVEGSATTVRQFRRSREGVPRIRQGDAGSMRKPV